MNSLPQSWRNVRGRFTWWIWSMFGWLTLFAFVVCAWIAINRPHEAGLHFLFGAAALVFGVLSLGCFVIAVVGFVQWVSIGLRNLTKLTSRSSPRGWKDLATNDRRNMRPSLWYCAFGVAVILAGVGLFVYFLVHGMNQFTGNLTQIVVPGEKDLTMKPNYEYTIFLETKSVVDGRVYSTESLGGLACVVTSQASGNKIETHSPAISSAYDLGSERSGKSVLEFITEEAGVYRVVCDYAEGSQGPPAVLAVGSNVGQMSTMEKGLGSGLGGIFLGWGLIKAVLILRGRAKRQFAGPN